MDKDRPVWLAIATWVTVGVLSLIWFWWTVAWGPEVKPLLGKPIVVGNGTRIVVETPYRLSAVSCNSFLLFKEADVRRAQRQETADKILSCITLPFRIKSTDELLTAGDWTLYSEESVSLLANEGAPATIKLIKSTEAMIAGSLGVLALVAVVWLVGLFIIALILESMHLI